jgi:hypothetical protein
LEKEFQSNFDCDGPAKVIGKILFPENGTLLWNHLGGLHPFLFGGTLKKS